MSALRECPFCGGPAQIVSGAPGCHYVRCEGCSATSDDRGRESAIEAWNRRPEPSAPSPAGVEVVWLRDLDGTGSMHPCLAGDPRAVAYVPAASLDQATRRAEEAQGTWVPTLAEELAERHKRQMIDTEREAFQAAQSGDKARQSIASTESERHRAVYHAMCLILDDQRKSVPSIPRAANCAREALSSTASSITEKETDRG